MKIFTLTIIASWIIFVYSHTESTQQVTLSCPTRPEADRGPPGVPGKRGSKGEAGIRGECLCVKTVFSSVNFQKKKCKTKKS